MRAVRLHGRRDIRVHDEAQPEPGPGEAAGRRHRGRHLWLRPALVRGRGGRGRPPGGTARPGPRGGRGRSWRGARRRRGRSIRPSRAGTASVLRGRRDVCEDLIFAGGYGQDGALREVMAWRLECLIDVPDEIDQVAALMLEPLGVAIHAFGLARPSVGDTVGVFGSARSDSCSSSGQVLGARTIVATDRLPHRLEAALRCGATDVALVDEGRERTTLSRVAPGGLDATFEAVGEDDAVETAMHLARPASRGGAVGIPGSDRTSFPASLARQKGLSFLVSRRMNQTYPRAIELVRSGRIDVLSVVTHRYPLAESVEAFETASRRDGLKVVIEIP